MSTVIEVKGLTKTYGKVAAVQDVSFSIESNKIYGLLGRNGAGKTTLMHLITAQQFASSGDLQVFGEHPYENNRVLSQCCFIKESQKYPDSYRIIDLLEISSSFFPNWDRDYAYSLIELFRLPLTQKIKKLSRGMLSSVGIVVGLASRAPLTMFDEPYLGLDAVSRGLFYEQLLEDYGKYPRTIILSTHLIDEVSQMLEHVMVIDNGKLIIDEDADELRGLAFTVVGSTTSVESFVVGRNVIDRKPLGGLMSATIMTRLSVRDQQQANTLGLELSSISLQQLIIHMTNGRIEGKVAIHE
ncbi:ABC transporter ATP-binding protein [Paenibacillus glacialis]|uniref:ABC transporter ATP-binding protein n=1 Tax=Paenibacillus glacialis TaxID=494026 RepID=A0A168INV3_9BACL|nr:ABC transporter ATP-binding protein [Paenibacillus glacialis]OAB39524.1 ABC transporter ATP-binding protein [Paenibacillus glacialis]